MTQSGRIRRQYSEDEVARVLALYRQMGKKPYRTAKASGVPRMTIVQWVQRFGENFGAAPAKGDVALVPESGEGEEGDVVNTHTFTGESVSSKLATLVKLDRIRHLYLDRMSRPDVVQATNSRDASAIVQASTAQIQLLTGEPTGRSEHQVRYVDRGALREMARRERQQRAVLVPVVEREG